MFIETRFRTIAKIVTWRILLTIMNFTYTYIVTGHNYVLSLKKIKSLTRDINNFDLVGSNSTLQGEYTNLNYKNLQNL